MPLSVDRRVRFVLLTHVCFRGVTDTGAQHVYMHYLPFLPSTIANCDSKLHWGQGLQEGLGLGGVGAMFTRL